MNVLYEPVEGMRFKAVVKNIKKQVFDELRMISPVVVFIAHDHHFKKKEFSQLNIDDDITVRVIGIRYELNDNYISVIAELVTNKKTRKKPIKIIINKTKAKNKTKNNAKMVCIY